MKLNLQVFLSSLLSRKFLLAVTTGLGLWQQHRYTEAAGIVLAWLAAEGVADVKSRSTGSVDPAALAAAVVANIPVGPIPTAWPPPPPPQPPLSSAA